MRLLLIGPPASGKGTQAKLLTKHFKINHISTGDMLREAVSQGTDLGLMIATYLKHGWLVPDHHVMQLVEDRLAHDDITNGFILDGFPRTLSQAHSFDQCLQQKNLSLDAAVLINVGDDAVLERITGRRTDPATGRIYHLKFDPPPSELIDQLEQRGDDTEAVMKERLATYHQEIAPVLEHYNRQDLMVQIDGTPPPDQVFKEILSQLETIPQKG